ncbi:DUF4396 domain-containing protein [Albidovulum sp.]|uniref:DUF4396 domain-containing protein n=1 Tax=Albidovulum sp. TaxID=1872424 RepID=UPI0039B85BE4
MHSDHHKAVETAEQSLNRLALAATVHCLTGCGIGEVLGMVIGTALHWGSLALSLVLAGLAAFPVNRWLIRRGRGHAVVHSHHHNHH